jgi:TolA-binding protein
MAPKRASSKAAPSVDEAAKAALLAEKKGKALADTTHQEACEDDALSKRQRNDQPTPEGTLRTCSSGGQPQAPPGFAPLEGEDAIEDGEVIGVSAEEQLQLRVLRIKNRNLQKQKEILEAKHQRISTQAKVRQMIRDEEQRAQELEQEIALMQREGQHDLHHGPPLQQRAPIRDLFIPQRGPVIPHAAAFQGVNYLDEQSPLAPQLQVSPWPTNFRAGAYPKYNGSTDPAQYIMSYQVAIASSVGDDATMAKSFIIALEGPALTWYTRLPPLSIDFWRSLRDKFLLNFQGYRPDTDALAELSLCKQLEK